MAEPTSDVANIGMFALLPQEIRDLVWKECLPHPGFRRWPVHDRRRVEKLGILRTCRNVSREISEIIYRRQSLRMCARKVHRYCTDVWVVDIVSSHGLSWQLETFEDAEYFGLDNFPFNRLCGIQMGIEAPYGGDPIDVLCMWEKARVVTKILSHVTSLPNLDIHLLETSFSWSRNGAPKKTINFPTYKDHQGVEEPYEPDYKVALLPFGVLRGVRKACIHVSGDFVPEGSILDNYTRAMSRGDPFGSAKGTDYWADNRVQMRLDAMYLQFEHVLDICPGPIASQKRLDRFPIWIGEERSPYFDEWERIQQTGLETFHSDIDMLSARYRALIAFNPRSIEMQMMRSQIKQLPPDRKEACSSLLSQWDMGNFGFYDRYIRSLASEPFRIIYGKYNPKPKSAWASVNRWNIYYQESGIPVLDKSNALADFLGSMTGKYTSQWKGIKERHWATLKARNAANQAINVASTAARLE
ncbi:hypothetical protein DL95DRAFT_499017 [Leptodontidium sp. 2 PMI_412]|nr:hypothetical protein DL95DRAFT_499017 [Leptodontidium sp. 2 PMI_412]